jgi:hypothetical protein
MDEYNVSGIRGLRGTEYKELILKNREKAPFKVRVMREFIPRATI